MPMAHRGIVVMWYLGKLTASLIRSAAATAPPASSTKSTGRTPHGSPATAAAQASPEAGDRAHGQVAQAGEAGPDEEQDQVRRDPQGDVG